MSEATLPNVGAKSVHKDDHAKSAGPVWEVTEIDASAPKPIIIEHAPRHKLNRGLDSETRELTPQEYRNDYREL